MLLCTLEFLNCWRNLLLDLGSKFLLVWPRQNGSRHRNRFRTRKNQQRHFTLTFPLLCPRRRLLDLVFILDDRQRRTIGVGRNESGSVERVIGSVDDGTDFHGSIDAVE